MKFTETDLKGAFIIELEPRMDNRGYFARAYDENEFAAHGLITRFPQANTSWNERKGTLRGMHYQAEPHGEVKLVRCTKGRLLDVIIDLRPDSPTFKQHIKVELSQANRKMLYIPVGFAHGYQTLEDSTEAFYMVGEFYTPSAERAVRWNDPAFAIAWPLPDPILSEKDAIVPDFTQ